MMGDLLKHLRVLEPQPGVLAFYDGRVPGHQFAEEHNWVDDGALSLGIASYAVLRGTDALVYDTHITVAHARFIRDTLAARGATNFTVVLSHWHLDHVAGTAVFADCPIVANRRTFAHLCLHKAAIEQGTCHGPPAIAPLVLPDTLFEQRREIKVGDLHVELLEANIHSDDATVIWIPDTGVLLAGDTMEDTLTYVGDPASFDIHLSELDRLADLKPGFILPNHGDPDIIAAGGYDVGLVKAQQQYIRTLKRCRADAALRDEPLEKLIAGPLSRGWVGLFEPYRDVHRQNLEQVMRLEKAPWQA
jgi:glyoxylase-like metal-dependent hydrolase (beta-lactamase superfamily II)